MTDYDEEIDEICKFCDRYPESYLKIIDTISFYQFRWQLDEPDSQAEIIKALDDIKSAFETISNKMNFLFVNARDAGASEDRSQAILDAYGKILTACNHQRYIS
jgi:hypothetical protein